MNGLVGTGLGYKRTALSGLVRESALEERRKKEEEYLKGMQKAQRAKTGGQLAGVGAVGGYAGATALSPALVPAMQGAFGAYAGAYMGSAVPIIGTIIGAGLGYLFSNLF